MVMNKQEYFNRYLKMVVNEKNRDKNGETIWMELEEWHLKKFGFNRFKSYGHFRKEKSIYHASFR
jgi:hypothetical protein